MPEPISTPATVWATPMVNGLRVAAGKAGGRAHIDHGAAHDGVVAMATARPMKIGIMP